MRFLNVKIMNNSVCFRGPTFLFSSSISSSSDNR